MIYAGMPFLVAMTLIMSLVPLILADLNVDCRYGDIVGTWDFFVDEDVQDSPRDCSRRRVIANYRLMETRRIITLSYPNVAVDQFGNEGSWTMVYNQGFEVVMGARKFFAFFKHTFFFRPPSNSWYSISYCGDSMFGWISDPVSRKWGCFSALKTTPVAPRNQSLFPPKIEDPQLRAHLRSSFGSQNIHIHGDKLRSLGGANLMMLASVKSGEPTAEIKKIAESLPPAWDWRNVNGTNFVGPVRDQMHCGSCYAWAALGMLESRIRIVSNNSLNVSLSVQDVVECSPYSQGCSGGFPYLVGKYAEDFGLVHENCNPYTAKEGYCQKDPNCAGRYFGKNYRYVGGFFGGCSHEAMMVALVQNGPLAVTYAPMFTNEGGIKRCDLPLTPSSMPEDLENFDPYQWTNHAAQLVGYGVDEANGEKYWIVKNSHGKQRDEKGFFRIRRGTNECAIESMAAEIFPVL